MAATKKSTSTAKKRSTPAKKPTKRAKVASSVQSFRIVSSDTPFFSFTFTKQSLYWLIFMLTVLALGVWIVYLQDQINMIYDRIDSNSLLLELTPEDYEALRNAANENRKN